MLVATTVDGRPEEYPSKLGFTDTPDISRYTLPRVVIKTVPDSGGFSASFVSTNAVPDDRFTTISVDPHETTPPTTAQLAVARHQRGDYFDVPSEAKDRFGLAPIMKGTIPADGLYDFSFLVTKDDSRRIRVLEQEHPDDFQYAFEMSLKLVADTVNQLSGRSFTGTSEEKAERVAMHALWNAVPAALRPPEPMFPESWERHLTQVIVKLNGLSSLRDSREEHSGRKAATFPVRGQQAGRMTKNPKCEIRTLKPDKSSTKRADLITFGLADLENPSTKDPLSADTPTPTSPPPWPAGQDLVLAQTLKGVELADPHSNATSDPTFIPEGLPLKFTGQCRINSVGALRYLVSFEGGERFKKINKWLLELSEADVQLPAAAPVGAIGMKPGDVALISAPTAGAGRDVEVRFGTGEFEFGEETIKWLHEKIPRVTVLEVRGDNYLVRLDDDPTKNTAVLHASELTRV